jgi:alpha-glucosidase
MKKIVILYILTLTMVSTLSAFTPKPKPLTVTSPDGRLTLHVHTGDTLAYSVTFKNQAIVLTSPIALSLPDRMLGAKPQVAKTTTRKNKGTLVLPYGSTKTLDDQYNELEVTFEGNYALTLRAYNEGVAYRFSTTLPSTIQIVNERASFNLTGDPAAIFPESDVWTSWEVPYVPYTSVSAIAENKKALTPVLFSYDPIRVVIAEADVTDYPGMYVGKHNGKLQGTWAGFPARTEMGSWGNFVSVVKERAPYIADTRGTRTFPWRIIIATDDDRTLVSNKLVYKLARPSVLGSDLGWIKPGKAAWEWWHDAIVKDAGIPTGMDNRNTALYKHYIDFAAANHLEYLMIDAGWSNIFDLSKVNPKVDVEEVIRYGKSKNVGVFLWCVATTLMNDPDKNMDLISKWGAVGLKVDFIDRDDQLAIRWFEDIASAAAKKKLMINFHGCSKPTGLERTYPNIVNYEAVRGAECSKWDLTANPEHHVLIPFIRMLAGPLDYTPGGMRNKTQAAFKPIDPGLPSTQGTRCHELAMYVLFDQPFAMLCDSPEEYRKYPDIMKYLSAVPTSFDETRVLNAKLGQYAAIAKRKDNKWFVGAMTDWDGRTLPLDFSFLPSGKTFKAEVYTDGTDNQDAAQYTYKTLDVTNRSKTDLVLAPGGGAVVYIHE